MERYRTIAVYANQLVDLPERHLGTGYIGQLLRIGRATYKAFEYVGGTYNTKVTAHVMFGEPHRSSYAALVLLNEKFSNMDKNRNDKYNWRKWTIFRQKYLKYLEKKNGELVCEYCGKRHLKIHGDQKEIATIDHVKPLCMGGERYDIKNMAVTCYKCNQAKGHEDYTMRVMRSRNFIKYIYVSLKNAICTFLSSLSRS